MAPKRRKNDDDDDNHDDDHPDDDGVNMNDNGGDNDDDDADRFKVVGDFKSGSITCIKLQNFLTYSHVELRPGPRLNMVVGANGTGKSSILNAICLGLGGDQNLLGRADDARDYIQHGKDHAVIEIHVAPKKKTKNRSSMIYQENQDGNDANDDDDDDDENATKHVFRREISSNKGSAKGRGRGASTFYINDEKVTVDKVRELASKHYNISIDNLCTFLPQDKVGSFSGFNAQQLLIETEKTLSSCQHYYHTHMELIAAEQELVGGDGDLQALKKQYDRLKAEHDRMQVEKERMEERDEAINAANLLNKKRIWLQFDFLRRNTIELKERKTSMKQKIRDAKAAIQPLEQEHQAVMAQLKECNARYENYQKKIAKCQQEKEKQDAKFENHDTEIENCMTDLQELDSKRHALEKRRDEAQSKLHEYESGLAEMPSLEEITSSHQAAYQEYQDGKKQQKQAATEERKYHDMLQELSDTAKQCQDKLARMANEGAQRKARIFRQNPQLAKIYEWIDANRSKFRRSVWGPIACEISPQSEEAATFLEQHVPNTFLKAFVVETKEDEDKLYDAVRNRLKLPINIIVSENGRLDPNSKRPYSEQKMSVLRDEHDVSYLDDLFEAPDAVMQALRNLASVHKVLVGGKRASENIEQGKGGLLEFLSEPEGSLGQSGLQSYAIFTTESKGLMKYNGSKSRFSGKVNLRVDDVRPAKMLAPGVDTAAKERAEAQLEELHSEMDQVRPKHSAAQEKKNAFEIAAQESRARALAFKERKEDSEKYRRKIDSTKKKVDDLEKQLSVGDERETRRRLVQALMKHLDGVVKTVEVHAEQQHQMAQLEAKSAGALISKRALVPLEAKLRRDTDEMKKSYEEIEREAIEIQGQFAAAKKELQEKRDEALSVAPLEDENGNDLPLKAELEALEVTTLHDLDAALEEAEAKANAIDANPNFLRRYQEQKEKMVQIEERLEDATNSKEAKAAAIETKQAQWESAVEENVAKINLKFERYMADMGFTGAVRLAKGESEDESKRGPFSTWGIEIRVSFRNGHLPQVLSAHSQSGGERSVSTIMYLMALQDMMTAPFRCVDEINQGLDDRNERLVFKRIVKNSTRRPTGGDPTNHSGQYFLITPKLLPNLYDMEAEAVTVLVVFNGPKSFQSPTEWNVDNMLECSVEA